MLYTAICSAIWSEKTAPSNIEEKEVLPSPLCMPKPPTCKESLAIYQPEALEYLIEYANIHNKYIPSPPQKEKLPVLAKYDSDSTIAPDDAATNEMPKSYMAGVGYLVGKLYNRASEKLAKTLPADFIVGFQQSRVSSSPVTASLSQINHLSEKSPFFAAVDASDSTENTLPSTEMTFDSTENTLVSTEVVYDSIDKDGQTLTELFQQKVTDLWAYFAVEPQPVDIFSEDPFDFSDLEDDYEEVVQQTTTPPPPLPSPTPILSVTGIKQTVQDISQELAKKSLNVAIGTVKAPARAASFSFKMATAPLRVTKGFIGVLLSSRK